MNKKFFVKEAIGGFTTFLTMSYIVILNPQIMSSSGTGITSSAALTSAVLLCFLMTLVAGLFIKLPYAVGPGVGINSFIVYSIIIGKHIPWQTAMGIIFLSSILFFIISLTSLRQMIIYALPDNLKNAIICGIGLLLAYVGIRNLGILKSDKDILIRIGEVDSSTVLGFIGFIISFYFFYRRKPYAFLISILTVTFLALGLGKISAPSHLFSMPDFSNFFQLNILSALRLNFLSIIIAILLATLFDSTASLVAIAETGKFINKNNEPVNLKQSLIVDSSASLVSSLFGTTPGLIFLESSSGIEAGAKTGVASIITSMLFLPCLFVAPILGMIPAYATAPILIFIGILMTQSLTKIKVSGLEEVIPVFLTIILMPLSSSVTLGVFTGILSYILLKICVGQYKKISIPLYAIGGICIASFLLEKI